MPTCNNGIEIPDLEVDICNGETKPTACIIHADAIPSLELAANSTQAEINAALVLVINILNTRITALETLTADLEARILELETP